MQDTLFDETGANLNFPLAGASHQVALQVTHRHTRDGSRVDRETLDEGVLPNIEDAHLASLATTEHPLFELGVGQHSGSSRLVTYVF